MKEEPKMTSKRDLGTSQKLLDEIFDQQISPKVLRHLEINEGKNVYQLLSFLWPSLSVLHRLKNFKASHTTTRLVNIHCIEVFTCTCLE